MFDVAELPTHERAQLFQATADDLAMLPAAVEKDFWVCWVLKKIFSDPVLAQQLLFKGGTSLSKCFSLIERFSEDIDLILDWNLLTNEDPYEDRSKTQQDKFNKQIEAQAQAYLKNELLGHLTHSFADIGALRPGEPGKRELIFQYPKAFEAAYIRPEILIEVGPMSAMAPNQLVEIEIYSAKAYSRIFKDPKVSVRTIAARKTFWDKITILHVEAHRPADKQLPPRYSRHYYDIYQMLNSKVKVEAMKDLALLISVAEFKNKFYPQGWANYQSIPQGTVRLSASPHFAKALARDYEGMREMIHGDYPDFSEIMHTIENFEAQLNEALAN